MHIVGFMEENIIYSELVTYLLIVWEYIEGLKFHTKDWFSIFVCKSIFFMEGGMSQVVSFPFTNFIGLMHSQA